MDDFTITHKRVHEHTLYFHLRKPYSHDSFIAKITYTNLENRDVCDKSNVPVTKHLKRTIANLYSIVRQAQNIFFITKNSSSTKKIFLKVNYKKYQLA